MKPLKVIESMPLGRTVICDWCGEDWTDQPESGGFMFQRKAACPTCDPIIRASAAEHGEGHFISKECPANVSFADWVRQERGPNATVQVITFEV